MPRRLLDYQRILPDSGSNQINCNLPYLPAKLQFAGLLSESDMHKIKRSNRPKVPQLGGYFFM